jgi:hypothetical protein
MRCRLRFVAAIAVLTDGDFRRSEGLSMLVRRCAILMLEPRERAAFDFALLAEGGSGLYSVIEWVAFAPHLGGEVVVSADEARVLGELSPSKAIELDELAAAHPRDVLDALVEKGLLVVEGGDASARDARARTYWRPAAAVMHAASRWQGVDSKQLARDFAAHSDKPILDHLGAPPPPARERVAREQRQRCQRRSPRRSTSCCSSA